MTDINIKTLPNYTVVVTVETKQKICLDIVKECYETHESLNMNDIEWATAITCNILLDQYRLDEPWISMQLFILYVCKSIYVGSLSYIYNTEIDDAILNRNERKLSNLINLDEIDRWQEVTKNADLTRIERNVINERINMEKMAILNMLSEIKNSREPLYITNDPKSVMNIEKEEVEMNFLSGLLKPCDVNKRNVKINNYTLYETCLEGICIEKNRNIELPDRTIIMDDTERKSSVFSAGEKRCYTRDELLKSLSIEPTVDPRTNGPYSTEIERKLRERYATEIKIYKFYLSYMENTR